MSEAAVQAGDGGPVGAGHRGALGGDLTDRIKWTTLARVVLVSGVLAFAVAMDLGMTGGRPQVPDATLYQLASSFYFASFLVLLGTLLAGHQPAWLRRLALAAVLLDSSLALALMAVTDGLRSVLAFAVPLAVLNSTVLLGRAGALASASLASLGLLGMGLCETGVLPWRLDSWRVAWLHGVAPPITPTDMLAQLAVEVAAAYATALLAARLEQELVRARQRAAGERAKLETLQVRFDDVVNSLPDGLLTLDRDDVVTSANPAALAILRLPPAQVVQRQLTELVPNLDVQTLEQDVPRALPDQGQQVLACRFAPLRTTADEPHPGRLLVVRDVTKEVAREAQHRRGERLAAIGAMAAAVAHEIRNPLASISGSVQMLQGSAVAESDRKLMEIVVRETHTLSAWIGELLDFARPRPLTVAPCDLRQLALETAEACRMDPRAQAAGIALTVGERMGSEPVVISADAPRLRQVVWNLLVNACHAAEEGEIRRVQLDLWPVPNGVELVVDDSGPGIEPADAPHVFEPFYTTKGGGTGLGLATVRGHVTAHHGEVSVGSSPLGGARFLIRLPRRPRSGFSALHALPAEPALEEP